MCRPTCCGCAARISSRLGLGSRAAAALCHLQRATRPAFAMPRSMPASARRWCITSPTCVRFLADVWRMLKPGGRACFTEPSFRYTRVMGMAFAEIIALLLVREFRLLRRPADLAQLGRRGAARHDAAGRSRAAGRPRRQAYVYRRGVRGPGARCRASRPRRRLNTSRPDGLGNLGGLLARIGVGEPVAGQIMRLWPSYARALPRIAAHNGSRRPAICSG